MIDRRFNDRTTGALEIGDGGREGRLGAAGSGQVGT